MVQMTCDMYASPHSVRSSINAALSRRCTSKNDGASTEGLVDLIGYCKQCNDVTETQKVPSAVVRMFSN